MSKKVADFKGFSGCKIELYSNEESYFVRKTSASNLYNERLKKQVLKQKYFFENMANERISAPKVLREGFIGSLFFFDMEYIQGIKLIDYIAESNMEDLLEISNDFYMILTIMKQSVKEKIIDDFTFKINQKINDIESGIVSKNNLISQKIIIDLKNLLSQIKIPKNVNQTFCHGDLTMENIIYDKETKKYYLIDFLDNFIDHYWFDITTLFQDIEGQWYKFRDPSINLSNLLPKMNFINNFLNDTFLNEEGTYKKYHNLFLALKFARILPYAKENDINYLIKTIKNSIDKHKNHFMDN